MALSVELKTRAGTPELITVADGEGERFGIDKKHTLYVRTYGSYVTVRGDAALVRLIPNEPKNVRLIANDRGATTAIYLDTLDTSLLIQFTDEYFKDPTSKYVEGAIKKVQSNKKAELA